jgi:hypothetical protein
MALLQGVWQFVPLDSWLNIVIECVIGACAALGFGHITGKENRYRSMIGGAVVCAGLAAIGLAFGIPIANAGAVLCVFLTAIAGATFLLKGAAAFGKHSGSLFQIGVTTITTDSKIRFWFALSMSSVIVFASCFYLLPTLLWISGPTSLQHLPRMLRIPGGWTQGMSLLDGFFGAAVIYVWCRTRMRGGFAVAIVPAMMWLVAGSRLGFTFMQPLPTFLIPVSAWVMLSGRHRPSLERILPMIGIVTIDGIVSPGLLVPVVVFAIAGMLTRSRQSPIVSATFAGAIIAILYDRVFGAFIDLPQTIVARDIDAQLRLISGDGTWPWMALFPALTSGIFGPLFEHIYPIVGVIGNHLRENAEIGTAAIFALVVAFLTKSRNDDVARVDERTMFVVILISAYAALPSHLFGVPLPTPAWLSFAYGSSGWLAPAAELSLTLGVVLLARNGVERLVESPNFVGYAFLILLLTCDGIPNLSLAANITKTPIALAVHTALQQAPLRPIEIFPSRFSDDPRRIVAMRSAMHELALVSGSDMTVGELPRSKDFLRQLLEGARNTFDIVDYAGYEYYHDAPFDHYIVLPRHLFQDENQAAWPNFPSLRGREIDALQDSVVLYR